MSQRHHSVKDLKSISGVKQKASQYPGSNETNKQVKQAILQELNSHLISIRPQIIHKKADEANKRLKKDAKKPNIKRSENVISDKGHLQDRKCLICNIFVPIFFTTAVFSYSAIAFKVTIKTL